MPQGTCSVCGVTANLTRGWCRGHYKRFLKYGDPLGFPSGGTPVPDLPGERWAVVPGYEGLYQASTLGRVKSTIYWRGFSERILTPYPDGNSGYLAVRLCRDGNQAKWTVHQLILFVFAGPCPPGQEVRHGPNGKFDNRLSELCYGTRAENQRPDRIRDDTDLHGERSGTAKLTDEIVIECRRRYAAGESQFALALEVGVSPTAMGHAVTGKTWKHLPDAAPHRRRTGVNKDKTHCPAGHEYAGDNLYVSPRGGRMCRTCRSAQKRASVDRAARAA